MVFSYHFDAGYPYQFYPTDKQMEEACVEFIKGNTSLNTEQAKEVYKNILQRFDLVECFAMENEEDLEYYFRDLAFEEYKEGYND